MTARTPMRLVLSTTQDVVEAVPAILGFHPHDSFVMLAVDGSNSVFGGRSDLATDIDEIPSAISAMLYPAVSNNAKGVILFVYDDEPRWPYLLEAAYAAYEEAGVPVIDLIHVHHGTADSKKRPHETVTLDQPGKIAAQVAYEGFAASRDREEHVTRVASDVDPARFLPAYEFTPEEARDFAAHVRNRIAGEELTLDEVIRLAAAVHDDVARDLLLERIMTTSRTPGGHKWWASVARNTPSCADTQHLFGLIALGLYTNGEGALCWGVLDRAPVRTNLVNLALQLLRQGVKPDRVAEHLALDFADLPDNTKENA